MAAVPTTPVDEIGEFALIDRLTRGLGRVAPPAPIGPGDDAAVIATGPVTLVTTDVLEEDVHFRRAWSLPEELGAKALEINLSDIAAMGGVPTAAVISLVLPAKLPVGAVEALYRGLAGSARHARIPINGGNISRTASDRLAVHVTVLGRPVGRKPVTRSGASPGDLLVVSGMPGLAALGRNLLENSAGAESLWSGVSEMPAWRRELAGRDPVARAALAQFLTPRARLELGALVAQAGASAMIDLSDGLAGDLRHLAKSSKVGARIDLTRLPVNAAVADLASRSGCQWNELALSGGEDYELLFAISPAAWKRLAARHPATARRLSVIGELLPARHGLTVADDRGERPLDVTGFRHF